MNFGFPDLETFIAIAEYRSYSRAAEHLNLTQPALSRRIHKLEASLGGPLFLRTTRSIQLTPIGQEFLVAARQLLAQAQDATVRALKAHSEDQELIRVACPGSMTTNVVPRAIRKFMVNHAKVRFQILDGHAEKLLAHVRQGECDLAVNLLFAKHLHPDLKIESVGSEVVGVAHSKEHRFGSMESIKWSDLNDERIIYDAFNSGNLQYLRSRVGQDVLNPNWAFQVSSLHTAIAFISNNLGVVVTTNSAIDEAVNAHIGFKAPTDIAVERELGFVQSRNANLSPTARRFKAYLLDELKAVLKQPKPR